jgi:hypothetical protein
MSANPLHHHDPVLKSHLHHQPVPIAFDVEDHSAFRQEVGTGVALFDGVGVIPNGTFDFQAPRIQGPPGISVSTLEVFQQRQIEDAHGSLKGGRRM